MAAFRSHLTALGRCSGGLESQGPALTLLPEGGNENSPGWSPPQRTEPWEGSQATRRAPRRAGRISPPHVARIVFDAMFLQEREELRLEIASSMMFFLARNVRNRCAHLRPANRERSVPLLPIEAFFLLCLVHPERRGALNLPHSLCDWNRRRKRKQNMDVILCSANGKSLEAMLSCNPAHVRPKSRLDLLRDRRTALLGGEDTMEQRRTIGV